MDSLLQLAERCEAAEGPDRELDLAIWAACIANEQQLGLVEAGRKLHGNSEAAFRADRMSDGARYTASLDAAMMLAENSGYAGLLLEIAKNTIAERFARECLSVDEYRTALARAFVSAAFRARHSQGVSDNGK